MLPHYQYSLHQMALSVVAMSVQCMHVQLELSNQYMWQSRVNIEHYSVAYFDRIAVFEAL